MRVSCFPVELPYPRKSKVKTLYPDSLACLANSNQELWPRPLMCARTIPISPDPNSYPDISFPSSVKNRTNFGSSKVSEELSMVSVGSCSCWLFSTLFSLLHEPIKVGVSNSRRERQPSRAGVTNFQLSDLGWSRNDAEFIQNRSPVGKGPSLKT